MFKSIINIFPWSFENMIDDIFKEIGFSHEIISFSSDKYGQADIEVKYNSSNFSEANKFIEKRD